MYLYLPVVRTVVVAADFQRARATINVLSGKRNQQNSYFDDTYIE